MFFKKPRRSECGSSHRMSHPRLLRPPRRGSASPGVLSTLAAPRSPALPGSAVLAALTPSKLKPVAQN